MLNELFIDVKFDLTTIFPSSKICGSKCYNGIHNILLGISTIKITIESKCKETYIYDLNSMNHDKSNKKVYQSNVSRVGEKQLSIVISYARK